MDVKGVRCEGMFMIHLAQNRALSTGNECLYPTCLNQLSNYECLENDNCLKPSGLMMVTDHSL